MAGSSAGPDGPGLAPPQQESQTRSAFLEYGALLPHEGENPSIEGELMEPGTGLLLSVAELHRELRPWPAAFFHAMPALFHDLQHFSVRFGRACIWG